MFIQEIERHLKEKLIPFWKGMKDQKYGGYYGEMNYALEVQAKANKGTIYHARILWFFSNANRLLKDEHLLEHAHHAYSFIKTTCFDETYGGVYWDVTYDGKAGDTTKHTYAQAFMVYALSSYYDVSQNQQALFLAKTLFEQIEEKCRDSFGYLEAFKRDFTPTSNQKLSENGIEADKTMNTLLHIFEAYTELYRVTKDSSVKKRLIYILNMVKSKIYNPKLQRQEVFFTKEMDTMIDLHSYGHDIEAAWLIDRGLEIIDDDHLTHDIEPITKALTQCVFEKAYVDSSLLNECENGRNDTNRIWWVQAEAMVGFANGYEKTPEKTEYLQAVKDIWEYIKNYMIDSRKGGEWYWQVDENHQADKKKPIVESWKAPYHNGRMCFEIIQRHDKLNSGG
mgnify:FL=1